MTFAINGFSYGLWVDITIIVFHFYLLLVV
jgi:hypothetical protein